MSIANIHYSCQGESHKATNKPCQDCSASTFFAEQNLTVAVVSDGHGGDRYFRSDIGSRLLCEITVNSIHNLISQLSEVDEKGHSLGENLFVGKPYTAIKAAVDDDPRRKVTPEDNILRQLFKSLIGQWNNAIMQHAIDTPFTEWEMEHVAEKYRNELKTNLLNDTVPAKTYGCTLMVYVQTDKFWFAFHLGDGKCIGFFEDDRLWLEPIPWDDRCFLNKTTSICDSDAINEFRYCYQGDGVSPVAIFLGSDGMDDSFGEDENLANFYMQVAKMLAKHGYDATLKSFMEDLPILSKRGSQDDMSIACVYDDEKLSKYVSFLIDWQARRVKKQIESINVRIQSLRDKKGSFTCRFFQSERQRIDFKYTQSDLTKAYEQKKALQRKIDILNQERAGSPVLPYQDEIGLSDNIPSPEDAFTLFLMLTDDEP